MSANRKFSFWRISAPQVLDLAVRLRPIRWVWTDKMLRQYADDVQLAGYEPGSWVYGLDAQNVRDVLSAALSKLGLIVTQVDPKTGILTVNYRLVAVVLFIAIGAANARHRVLRPKLAHMVRFSGPRMMSRWRLLTTVDLVTLRDHCHDHLASLKWYVRELDALGRAIAMNTCAPAEPPLAREPGLPDGAA